MEKKKVKRSQGGHAIPPPRRHTAPKLISIIEHLRLNTELPCIRKHSRLPFIKKKNRKISGLQETEYASEATSSLYGDNFVTGLSKIVGLENYTVVLTRHGKLCKTTQTKRKQEANK